MQTARRDRDCVAAGVRLPAWRGLPADQYKGE
jgi:hypothetical protein